LHQSPTNNSRVAPGQRVSITIAAEVVVVPQVLNMNLNDAMNTLSRNKLRVGSQSRQLTDRHRDGTVMEQHPQSGHQVDPNSNVNLVIAEAGVRVPRLIGSYLQNATQALSNLGLRYSVSNIASDRHRSGTIMQLTPTAGNLVRKGTSIQLSVATTPPPCIVPNLSPNMLHPTEALRLLQRSQLNGQVQGSSTPYSRATHLSPSSGSRVNCGSTVTIYTKEVIIEQDHQPTLHPYIQPPVYYPIQLPRQPPNTIK